jgi:hypothetical protein
MKEKKVFWKVKQKVVKLWMLADKYNQRLPLTI